MAEDEPDRDVMSSLPRTRPQRRSAKRDAPAKRPASGNGKRAAAKPKAAPKRAPAKEKAAAKPRTTAGAKAQKMPPAGFAPPRDVRREGPPSGPELLGTAVQAAAELAQIGLAVGGHALRSALDRLPTRRGT